MDRGVIAAPGIITPLAQGFMMERSVSSEELRYYIMYWDRVVIPGNNLVYIGIPEEEELIACGAITRPKVGFQGSFQGDQVANVILSCQSIVANELVKDKSVDWIVHQIGSEIVIPDKFSFQQETVKVVLVNALPVPDGETPINEILEFKERRKDQLVELHEAIDGLYFEVLNSPDPELATKKAVTRFKTSIEGINAVANEKFKKTRKYDLTAELNLNGKDIVSGASAGAVIDFFSTGFSIPIATIVGALAALIKVKANLTYTFEPAKENSKLSYLSYASNENIIEYIHNK